MSRPRKRSGLPGVDRRRFRRLSVEMLERRNLLAMVTGVAPAANAHHVSVSTEITATFDENINPATATARTLSVHSAQGGLLRDPSAAVSTAGMTVTLDPSADFFPGDLVQASVTAGITGVTPAVPHVWQFRTAATGSGVFVSSGQGLGDPAANTSSWGVEVGDLDADGDLDVFMANLSAGNRVYLNNGSGEFTDSGQSLGDHRSRSVALGDMDGDGDLDAIVANDSGHQNRIWQNDGNGVFSEQTFGGNSSRDVKLGDLDGDGDLDAFVGNGGQPNRVYLNNSGLLADTGQTLGSSSSRGLSLGDMDGDGDLDAVVANEDEPQRVWFNDGSGVFTDSGQALFNALSRGVGLGDLDGDGDLDALITSRDYSNKVWLNEGNGVLVDSGQALGQSGGGSASLRSEKVEMGDLDGDGDLDAFVSNNNGQTNRIWVNDGNAVFTDSGQNLDIDTNSQNIALGDLDGDGDLDAVIANDSYFGGTNSVGRIWINQNLTPSVTLTLDNPSIAEAAGNATVTAVLSATHTEAVTVDLVTAGTATPTDDYTTSGSQIVIPAGATTGAITITAVQDTVDEPDETIVVDISDVVNGQEVGAQQVTATIVDDDEPIPVPDVTLSVDRTAIAEAAEVAVFTVTLSQVTVVPVTVELGISGSADASDYTTSGTQIVVAPGMISDSMTVTAVQDRLDEPDETVVVDIVEVSGGNELGVQQQTITITDDDEPKLTVTALTPTPSGFAAEFSAELNADVLNLYAPQTDGLGVADVTLQGASTGAVAGSLVVDASLRRVTFIKSGSPLSPDSYIVTLRSDANGFVDTAGQLLDGNDDGTEGDDYTSEFTVAEPAANSVTIGIPDFVRGPGQAVNLPADEISGIAVTISEGTNVRAVDLRVAYDPSLLTITGGSVGADAPAGASVIVNTSTPGLAILVFFSTTPLPAGRADLINLQATVPTNDASSIYGAQHVLDLHGVIVSDGNDNEAPVVVDDAFHQASFFSDVTGNGRINAADASGVARFAALIDGGFAGSPNADPLIVGDISGNGRLNAADASLLAQFAALILVPQIPPIPGGVVISGVPRVRPQPPFAMPGDLGTAIVKRAPIAGSRDTGGDPRDEYFDEVGSAIVEDLEASRARTRRASATADELGEEQLARALEEALGELLSATDWDRKIDYGESPLPKRRSG